MADREAVTLELEADVAAMLREHAAAEHVSEGEIVGRALRARGAEPQTRLVLDAEHWAAFCATLDRPAKVIPAVRELFERPRPE